MFYNRVDENDKNFQIKQSWSKDGKQGAKDGKQGAKDGKQPPKHPNALIRQDSKLKDAGSNAVNYDILEQRVVKAIVNDLGLNYGPIKDNQIENYLNANKIQGQSPIRQSPSIKSNSPKVQVQQNEDVLTSMATRLQKVEKLSNAQKLELKEKSQKIIELQNQIDFLNKLQSKDSLTIDYKNIKDENDQLKKKIDEMQKFLLEYGIKWVGNQADKDAHQKMKQIVKDVSQPKPLFNYKLPQEISVDVIMRRVDELNYIMEKDGGATEIVKNAQGMHQIKKMDQLPIGFYKNGIVMQGYKFNSYGSNDAYLILADILDGYFPYQLKKQYPNGTLLKVIDKTDEIYDVDKMMDQKQFDINNINEQKLRPQTKDEFLNKLPKQVIQNGKIIPIRCEIEKKFTNNNQDIPKVMLENTRIDNDGVIIILTQAQKIIDQGIDYDEDAICTLKFRTETGKHQIIAMMFSTDTVQQMYKTVERYKEDKEKTIEILLNFPRTVFDSNSNQSLFDAGLHPNAQLFFKLR